MEFKNLKLVLTLNAKILPSQVKIYGFFAPYKGQQNPLYFGKERGALTTIPSENKVYYCLGKRDKFTSKDLQTVFAHLLNSRFCHASYDLTSFLTSKISLDKAVKLFLAACFASRFILKTHKKSPPKLRSLHLNCVAANFPPADFTALVEESRLLAEVLTFCRNLQNEAPNLLFPATFATQIAEEVAKTPGLKLKVWDQSQLKVANFNLFLAVAAGNAHPPRLIEIHYQGTKASTRPLALIGKGITFDTGGYSLKPPAYQKHMKYDMSGAAIVCSTLLAIARLKLPVNVVGLACLTENLIGQNATLVESIITSKSGLTVEITNTDAEGRLVVADAITYAINDLKVGEIIELSTLTGAITVALGDHLTGAFTNNDNLYRRFFAASTAAEEPLWRLPVVDYNHKLMRESKFADLINASSDYRGGASNAAAFLFAFAGKTPFLHLDIAGTATTPTANKEGTAVMLRSLVAFFRQQTT